MDMGKTTGGQRGVHIIYLQKASAFHEWQDTGVSFSVDWYSVCSEGHVCRPFVQTFSCPPNPLQSL